MTDVNFESSETFELPDEQVIPDLPAENDKDFDKGLASALRIEQPEEKEDIKTLIAGMTEDELKSVLDKARRVDEINETLTKATDKAFGKIGQLEQTINLLKQTNVANASTPLTKESFKHLSEFLGDDDSEMVDAIAKDLSSIQFGGGQSQVIDYDSINSSIAGKVDELSRSFEEKLLTVSHPDWREISIKEYDSEGRPIFTDDYINWRASLNDDAKNIVDNSWNGIELSKAFKSFKDWKAKKANYEQTKQQRLDNAVRPSGIGNPGKTISTADDPFYQGLNSVINKHKVG
jgi:hypothetical protein